MLYKYLRTKEYLPKAIVTPTSVVFNRAIKVISSTTLIIELGTKFGFRSYYFLTLFIVLSIVVIAFLVCLDTGYLVILINRAFLLKQVLGIYIRTIASPISIRGIGSNYYTTREYVLLEIYLPSKYYSKDVRTKLTREAYLIDGLKVKILLGTNIIGPEKINIIASKS